MLEQVAVLGRDIDAIIRTHVGDRKVAAWFTDTAEAFEEIGEYDLAIDWARQAITFDLGHQSVTGARYWVKLVDTLRPAESLDTHIFVFRRSPNSSTASELHRAASDSWPTYRDEVMENLSRQPYEAATFTLGTLNDPGPPGIWPTNSASVPSTIAVPPSDWRGCASSSRHRTRRRGSTP